MNFSDLHVVVTGGTGALGRAVVQRLLTADAIYHIPNFNRAKLEQYPHADHPNVQIKTGVDLTDEAAVAAFYGALPELWASVNLVGGFAMAPVTETTRKDAVNLLNINTLTCFLSCREVVKTIRERPKTTGNLKGGRIVNVAARPGIEPRTGKRMAAYAASKAAAAGGGGPPGQPGQPGWIGPRAHHELEAGVASSRVMALSRSTGAPEFGDEPYSIAVPKKRSANSSVSSMGRKSRWG